MKVIPVINCKDTECIEGRLDKLISLDTEWVKFDISDGKFNPVLSWNSPESLGDDFFEKFNVGVHFMVLKPEDEIEKWLKCGASRIIIHVESEFNMENVLDMSEEYGAEIMISKKPDTSLDKFEPFLNKVDYFQLLAVAPGYSGQDIKKEVFDEIEALRHMKPDVKIEVDGGIDEDSAVKVKKAGADIIVSSSYIFESKNPKEAFEKLKLI